MYVKFLTKLIGLFANELFKIRTATEMSFGLLNNRDFDKKIVKIYKALRVMEKQKQSPPKFSDEFREFAVHLATLHKSELDTMSKFSSVGECFRDGFNIKNNDRKERMHQSLGKTNGSFNSENHNCFSTANILSSEFI